MERVAIVGGVRTPFVRAGGALSKYSFVELGTLVVQALAKKLNLESKGAIDELFFSTVLLDPRCPNWAREIVLRSGLPKTLGAHAVSNNCISGLVAANMAAEAIAVGRITCAFAGGAESMSRPALAWRPQAEKIFLELAKAKGFGQKLKLVTSFRLKHFTPLPPSPREPSTGLTMGQHCELSAQEFGISRVDQDNYALSSHQKAANAQNNGFLEQEIVAVGKVEKDGLIRADTTLEKLAKLPAVFDKTEKGTLSAGNSSSLTDGASVICLMSETRARAEGREILGFWQGAHFSAIDPADGLLMAPGLALPQLFERFALNVNNVDLFEVHEAFAAQVLANRQIWEKGWAKYPEIKPIGQIPDEKFNLCGGSLALGHPFAATGGRLVLSLCNQLKRNSKKRGVISVCAAGAMASAVLISSE